MAELDRRTRLLRALARLPVDRCPVICTGGSMTATPEQVVTASGFALPAAHGDGRLMAGLALAAARLTGFEAVGVPLCTTVEAEALGAVIDLGDARTEARVRSEPFGSIESVRLPSVEEFLERGRIPVVIAAVEHLAKTAGDLPVIANMIGPLSVAAALVDPTKFLRELRTKPEAAATLASQITEMLQAWSARMLAAGADIIAVHEDTVTPALVGPKTFATAVVPHLHRLVEGIHHAGGKVVLHMCGALGPAAAAVADLGLDGYIPDAALPPAQLRETLPGIALIGNLSTFLLHQGDPAGIAKLAARLAGPKGMDVVSPTCGMSSITPLANIRAMTGAILSPLTSSGERDNV